MSGYVNGSPGPGATLVQPKVPNYGSNKHGSMIDSGSNGRRTIVFDIAVTDAVVAGSTDQNAVLYTLGADTLIEGIAVKNIGNNALASGAGLVIDDTSTDLTGDIQSLAAGDVNLLTFRLPTAAAGAISVDGANGIICASSKTTTLRVCLFVVDATAMFEQNL
jgi:hypothetical protein